MSFTEEEAGTESQGGRPSLLAQLLSVEAKIETQEMNQEMKTGVTDKQPSDLLYKVWVGDRVSEDGYSNLSHVFVSAI